MMKQFFRKTMKNIATYVELVLSAFLVFVIAILIIKLVGQCFFDIWHDKLELEYYMEYAMSIAIGVEFVKMLCTHQPIPTRVSYTLRCSTIICLAVAKSRTSIIVPG